MHWFFEHPYRTMGILLVLAMLGIGALIVHRSSVTPSEETLAWGGRGALANIGEYAGPDPERLSDDVIGSYIIASQLQSQAPFSYIPSLPLTPEGESDASIEERYDFDSLIALLTNDTPSEDTAEETPAVRQDNGFWGDAFSFIPRGLVVVKNEETNKTPVQKKLYSYGNQIGIEIQMFEDAWPNAVQILYDQAQDRENLEKAEAARRYARSFADVGKRLEEIGDVPAEAKTLHDALAHAYQNAGMLLEQVPGEKTEKEFLDAVLAYNAGMDVFTDSFIDIALMFSAHGVVFREEDAGSTFTFRPVSF